MMQMLLVLIFENETGAQEMIGHVQVLQRQQLITISDAAFIIRKKDEKVKVKQANSLVGSGILGGAFWGLLIGQYFWLPPSPNRTETTIVDNTTSDCGIDADFLQQVGLAINPGYSALFMIVAYMTEEILDVLAGYSDTLLYTTLSGESDTKLREAFGIVE
jgi:uncharacterized membrane protein